MSPAPWVSLYVPREGQLLPTKHLWAPNHSLLHKAVSSGPGG